MHGFAISISDVHSATATIAGFVRQTPVVQTSLLKNSDLILKCENLQQVNAFKARGAVNAVFNLTEKQQAAGIVTHSSGNHAAAIARAGKLKNLPVTVVMPENSSSLKIEAVRNWGVEPQFCEPTAEARQEAADEVVRTTGATFIHPFDNPFVMAGQGTVALEILQQVPDIDVVIVPVGGGGLLSGVATVMKTLRPSVKVIAAEPEWADDAKRSFETGQRQPAVRYDTICDGLRTPVGELTFPVIHHLVDSVETASEDSIRAATVECLMATKLLVEPSAAVAIAVAQNLRASLEGKRIVAVMTGGNLTQATLSEWLTSESES